MKDFYLGLNMAETTQTWEDVAPAQTVYELLQSTAAKFPSNNAISFQLQSGQSDPAETWTWSEFAGYVTQAANMFRGLGIGEKDVVAYLLPNSNETALTLIGGSVAGIVNPINPLLEPDQIAGILRETGAKVLVSLKAFPKTDLAQKAAEAVAKAPCVEHVVEVDLNHYLTGVKKLVVPAIRPKVKAKHNAKVWSFRKLLKKQRADGLEFADAAGDRTAAYFHTGGTTGTPKVAQHRYSGMIYNGWLVNQIVLDETDVILCPLPLFHVFAAYPMLMGAIASGAHIVFPTPGGYRGDGVFDNFWKLIERWGVTFMFTVPTAIAQLMQRPVDADVSTLNGAISGSAALPLELFNKFEKATGVRILEGYGMTEATCLVSCNPADGEVRVGSVGLNMPYTDVRILDCAADGSVLREMTTDEVGEICISNPGVNVGATFVEDAKNQGLYADGTYLRTGDLGRIDAEGYLWITGRAKDLIIRGGHNIDPALIEEALAGHPSVAFVGAIGQPDAVAGELPCAFVELIDGAEATEAELMRFARDHITERAAVPKHLEILSELPKTAVGKVFKPDLRKSAITRVYDAALAGQGHDVTVCRVEDDKKFGLVAYLKRGDGPVDEDALSHCLAAFTQPWRWDS